MIFDRRQGRLIEPRIAFTLFRRFSSLSIIATLIIDERYLAQTNSH
jgi:hypothetical protein